jgi:hypothetical protein
MKLSQFYLKLSIALFVACYVATPTRIFADTYRYTTLSTDGGVFFYGMDDAATVVLSRSGGPACGATCYVTYVDGVETGFSGMVPALNWDNGAACSPVLPAGASAIHAVCNNGREVFTGFLNSGQMFADVYAKSGADWQTLSGRGYGGVYMNSNGDILFDDYFSEDFVLAVDLTTRAASPVPEPGSLLLMGTGTLAALGALRRRFSK